MDANGSLVSTLLYSAFGETRYANGATPTDYRYTGQREEAELGLYFYNARWYDPALGRFVQPDSIIPSLGEGNNPNSIGYVANSINLATVVDYHEYFLLTKLNQNNKSRSQETKGRLQPVPSNFLAFDRYAYAVNNPIKYDDPSGHCVWDLCIGETIGIVELVVLVVAAYSAMELMQPDTIDSAVQGFEELSNQAAHKIQTLFARGEYVPPGLSETERRAYREAVHIYKRAYGLGPKDNVPEEILDDIADAIKEGGKPIDAADSVDGPPEAE